MSKCISNKKLTRQISHLTQYLPDQEDLNGKRGGASYYRHVNGRAFVEAYELVCKKVNGLTQKFDLTTEQKSEIMLVQSDLVKTVKHAFDEHDDPPANFEDFIQKFDQAM